MSEAAEAAEPVRATVDGDGVLMVRKVSGDVHVIRVDGAEGLPDPGDTIAPGDVIMTRADGELELVATDGTVIYFAARSRILIEPPENGDDPAMPQFFVIRGQFSIDNADSGGDPGDAVVVRTPVATITVRGARLIGKAAPEAQANSFVLLPGRDGTVGTVAVATAGAVVVLDEPLQGLKVLSMFREPTPLSDVDVQTLVAEFSPEILAYADIAGIPELALADGPTLLSQLRAVFGVEPAEASAGGVIIGEGQTLGDVVGSTGDDEFGGDRNRSDEEALLNLNNVRIDFEGTQDFAVGGANATLTGAGAADAVTIQADPVNANTVTAQTINGQAVLRFAAGGQITTVTLVDVEELAVGLGGGSDSFTLGDLSNSGIADNTVVVNAAAGDDLVDGTAVGRSVRFFGGDGNDTLLGGTQDDLIDGGAGDDLLSAGASGVPNGDTLRGGAGSDTLRGGADDDRLDGGSGGDTADFSTAGAAVTVDLAAGTASGAASGADTLDGIENVVGSAAADRLAGDAGDNRLASGAGNDTLIGGAGDDTLDGGAGIDAADFSAAAAGVAADLAASEANGDGTDRLIGIENLIGSAAADSLAGDGAANALLGGAGDDTLSGRGGDDTLNGGSGIDRAEYSDLATAVTVDLAAGTTSGAEAGDDQLIGIEQVAGSTAADRLTGSAGADTLFGNGGDDTLAGGAGTDLLAGGDGSDTADFSGSATAVAADLGAGTANDGGTTDTLQGIENLTGSGLGDTLIGDDGDNVIQGGDGDDLVRGGAGNDVLVGGDGIDTLDLSDAAPGLVVDLAAGRATDGTETDTLSGFEHVVGSTEADNLAGDDAANILVGSAGDDTLSGRGGDDRFLYSTAPSGNDLVDGGDGANDVFQVNLEAAAGATLDIRATDIDGGIGTAEVAAAMTAPLTQGATLTGVERIEIIDNGGDDVITIGNLAGTDIADGGILIRVDGGNDRIDGSAATLGFEARGGAGADTISPGAGNDTLNGANGEDVLDLSASDEAVDVNLAAGTAAGVAIGSNLVSNIETVIGGAGDDSIVGDAANNLIVGGEGDNSLTGGSGADTLAGGSGNDTFDGSDPLVDVVDYSATDESLDLDVNAATFTSAAFGTDSFISIDGFIGGAGNDTMTGSDGVNRFDGGLGDDLIDAAGGDDRVFAGLGDDTLIGGDGQDTLDFSGLGDGIAVDLAAGTASGAGGDDQLSGFEHVVGTAAADTISGSDDANDVDAGGGDDVLDLLGGNDNVTLGGGNDTADGGAGADTIRGDGGADSLFGGDGSDLIFGGTGDDTILGGSNNDTLAGGAGSDQLAGGGGGNAFRYDAAAEGGDVIDLFVSGVDRFLIDGTGFDNVAADGVGNLIDGLSFVAIAEALSDGVTALGTSVATFVFDGANSLHFDPDGDGADASFEIASVASGTVAATDFEVQ